MTDRSSLGASLHQSSTCPVQRGREDRAAASAATTGSDDALIQLCDQFRTELAAYVADVNKEGGGNIPMRVVTRRVGRREKSAAAIACLPAATKAGLKAKAAVIAYYQSIYVQEFDMEVSQLIAASLAADLLR